MHAGKEWVRCIREETPPLVRVIRTWVGGLDNRDRDAVVLFRHWVFLFPPHPIWICQVNQACGGIVLIGEGMLVFITPGSVTCDRVASNAMLSVLGDPCQASRKTADIGVARRNNFHTSTSVCEAKLPPIHEASRASLVGRLVPFWSSEDKLAERVRRAALDNTPPCPLRLDETTHPAQPLVARGPIESICMLAGLRAACSSMAELH